MTARLLPFDWPKVILYTHRWLGTVGGLLFLMWFVSGIVMMYARMPSLAPEERLMRLPALDLSTARVAPAAAARIVGLSPERMRVGMLADRPVYRFVHGPEWTTVFADNAQPLGGLTAEEAIRLGRRFVPEHASSTRYDAYLTDADQWTLQVRALMPMHRLALGDSEDTYLYLSDRTGEAVMKTTRSGRRWAYLGAVLHWLYFTPFRRHTTLWIQSVIWLSMAGCLLTLSGLVWGIWHYSPTRRYRIKGVPAHSPYAGLMRWHHYAGLIFGLTTFTWVLSGCLSLDPWSWHPSRAPTRQQREAVASGPLRLDPLTIPRLREGVTVITSSFAPKELEVVQFRGEPFLLAYRAPSPEQPDEWTNTEPSAFLSPVLPIEHRLVSVLAPQQGAFTRFDGGSMLRAARAAMPETAVQDAVWLQDYDAYYYDRYGTRPLPVLRVRYQDPPGTWLYLDPQRGLIVQKEERLSRLDRWLFHGLHRFDFPFLYYRRPLWDILVIALSLGGIILCTSTMVPAWRRLRRHAWRAAGWLNQLRNLLNRVSSGRG